MLRSRQQNRNMLEMVSVSAAKSEIESTPKFEDSSVQMMHRIQVTTPQQHQRRSTQIQL